MTDPSREPETATRESMLERLFGVRGRTVLVTGGTQGIGRMIAEGFVRAGAEVIVASRKADACEQTERELSQHGRCSAIVADLSAESGCRDLAEAVSERVERLNVLVNNAGATWVAPMSEFDDNAWDRVLALNVKAVFHTTRFLLPLLTAGATAADPSRVINIGSLAALQTPDLTAYSYSASKAAVHHLSSHLARELAPEVLVNVIAPGPFATRMTAPSMAERSEQIAARSVLGRIGHPDDIIGAALFFASRASAYTTGAVLPVEGGVSTVGNARP